ncbi:hypothetical protein SAMN05216267_104714 [Actinacidiphila rubida]|uniref:Metallo-beta-lactamase domain-containing protein n=2 Tax=Actinacidiphila rubida TaxID=310780 RepID=A0A1H8T1A7_9ACTN|nr:hypothetical protein SAMN05216267_104714 [Actinacidiphila rubida]
MLGLLSDLPRKSAPCSGVFLGWFWPDIHMTPAEGMQAHTDLSGGTPAGVMMPIHWATFNLAQHPWAEPGEGTVAAAREHGAKIATPRVGAPFEPADPQPDDWWWRECAVVPAGGWPAHPPRAAASKDDGATDLETASPA